MKTFLIKNWIWVLSALLVAGGASLWRMKAGSSKPTFVTTAVDRGDIVSKVTASGTVSALVTVQVGSQISGRVQALYADFNSKVRKGQLIARIDPQFYEAAMEQARANRMAAQANVERAKAQALDARRQFERAKSLAERQLASEADRDTAETASHAADAQVKSAEGSLAQANAALNQAKVNLAYTKIASPIDGVVISRSVDVGQTVAASLQAPTLFVIAEDLRKMQVDTNVSEADIGRIQPGMAVTFNVDAYPNDHFQGTVRQVRNAPQTIQNVVTYDAVIDVANPDLKLKPGMTANVNFITAERKNVLRVPNAALRFHWQPPDAEDDGGAVAAQPSPATRPATRGRPGAGERVVWVLRAGEPVRVPVQTGITDGNFTEVVSGALAEGDLVITDSSQQKNANTGGNGSGGRPPSMRRMF